jgi:hypothetical protein
MISARFTRKNATECIFTSPRSEIFEHTFLEVNKECDIKSIQYAINSNVKTPHDNLYPLPPLVMGLPISSRPSTRNVEATIVWSRIECTLAWLLVAMAIVGHPAAAQVKVFAGTLNLISCQEGSSNPNPPFDQNASGTRFNYPYTLRDNLTEESAPHSWRAVFLENEYLGCSILPDLGGHLYTCIGKIAGRPMSYANPSIKSAEIGNCGAGAAFGLEFNFPFSRNWVSIAPVDFSYATRADGSASVWVGNIDRVYGMQGQVELLLMPGSTLLKQHTTLYNRSNVLHRDYWWSNAAIEVWDDSRIDDPMRFVATHGFTHVCPWPVGPVAKHDVSLRGDWVSRAVSFFAHTHNAAEAYQIAYRQAKLRVPVAIRLIEIQARERKLDNTAELLRAALSAQPDNLRAGEGLEAVQHATLRQHCDPMKASAAFRQGFSNDSRNPEVYSGLDQAMSALHIPAVKRAAALAQYPQGSSHQAYMPVAVACPLALARAEAGQFGPAHALFKDRYFPSAEGGVSSPGLAFLREAKNANWHTALTARHQVQLASIARACGAPEEGVPLLAAAAESTGTANLVWALQAGQLSGNVTSAQARQRLLTVQAETKEQTEGEPASGFCCYQRDFVAEALGERGEAVTWLERALVLPERYLSRHPARIALET